MNSLESAFERLPRPILDKLQSMIRRIRRLLFLRGLFATLAVALACLLVIMTIDATLTLFSPAARWGLSLAGLAVTAAAAVWFLVRPLSRTLSLTRMARILEIRHPELQERISTAVELLSSDDPDSVKGSEELIRAVVDSAVDDVGTVDPKTEFQTQRGRKFIYAAAVFAGIILLALTIWPRQSWTLLARAVAPFLDIGNAYAESLVIDPGDIRIARGDALTISLSVNHKRLRRAELRTLLPDGSDSIERMNPVADEADGTKRFALTFPRVEDDFQYRIRAGAALSRYFIVEAIDPPIIEELKIEYDYPDYTQREASEVITETGEIRAVAHTRVAIIATVNKALQTSGMFLNETTDLGAPEVRGNFLRWETELRPGMNGTWHLALTDRDGFANEPVSYPLEVLPDKSPIVQLTLPLMREMKLRPTERLTIHADVVEDFGFLDAALLITPEGAAEPIVQKQPLPLAAGPAGQYHSTAVLDLPSLPLGKEQRRLAVQLQIRDNRPLDYDGPGIGLSEPIYITLDERAKSLADQAIEARKKELSENLREAKRELEQARDDMRRVEQELQRDETVNDRAREELRDFSSRTESAREKLDEVVATLNQTLFREQADQAAKISNETIREAREKADLIPVTDAKNERVKEARESREKIEEAIREVDAVSKAMQEADDEYRMISQLNDLANRQQELAMNAEEWAREEETAATDTPPGDPAAEKQAEQEQRRQMNQFQQQQNQVQQQLGQMLKDNAAALDQILEAQKEQAETMAEKAAALAAAQEALKEISAKAMQSPAATQQETLREQLLQTLQERQNALAEAARNDADSGTEADNSETEALLKGAEAGFETAKNLAGEKLNEAAATAAAASQSLAEAAAAEAKAGTEGDGEGEGETMETESADAETAAAEESPNSKTLAAAQAALAAQIEAVKEGNLQEALSLMEAGLNEEAAALSTGAAAFENALKNLSQQSAGQAADAAERSLRNGAREAAQSAQQLARAQEQQTRAEANNQLDPGELARDTQSSMQRSENDQARAAQSLREAAAALGTSAESIGQTREGLEPSDADSQVADSGELAEGFQEVSESARSQDAGEAAQRSREAARALQQLAQSAMQKLGNPGQTPPTPPGEGDQPAPPDLTGDPAGENLNESGEKGSDLNGDGIPPELRELGISVEDWTRFRGALVGGNATAIESDLPAEYRELVGRYFQVIAKEAGKKP